MNNNPSLHSIQIKSKHFHDAHYLLRRIVAEAGFDAVRDTLDGLEAKVSESRTGVCASGHRVSRRCKNCSLLIRKLQAPVSLTERTTG